MYGVVKVWKETLTLPTWTTGNEDANPMFLEKRVYQGSSGAVYPYGVIDTLTGEREMRDYQAVWMENDFIRIMLLPELGGRIHRAYDKVKQRDFVYYNEVVKPALVGLLGPWISGGIEFNWPQHHRPTTFMPVDFTITQGEQGEQTVWMGEVEPMRGLQLMAGFTLYPDRALVEITGKVFNGNATPRHFLWWSNPAVKGETITRAYSRQTSRRCSITVNVPSRHFLLPTVPITKWTIPRVSISLAIRMCQSPLPTWRKSQNMILSAPGITASAVACCTWRIITSRPEKNSGHGGTASLVRLGIVS